MLREGTGGQGQSLGDRSGQESGMEGAAGDCGQQVCGGQRDGGEERTSQCLSPALSPGPLEESTDGRKTGRRTDLVDRSGAHTRSRWAADDQRASQRGHQGGTWMTGLEFQGQSNAFAGLSIEMAFRARRPGEVLPEKQGPEREGDRGLSPRGLQKFKVSLKAAQGGWLQREDLPNRKKPRALQGRGGARGGQMPIESKRT